MRPLPIILGPTTANAIGAATNIPAPMVLLSVAKDPGIAITEYIFTVAGKLSLALRYPGGTMRVPIKEA